MKILLIPIAIVAFIVFLIVLGAIGLGVAFLILAALGKVWRFLTGARRGTRKAGRRLGRFGRRQRT
ncbi:MAG TPA: hypothetical protein VHE08_04665 [Solirubrobacterales bacterium]|nr:hypothetical protein [Solirubrobacterales bacterium]